MLYGAVCAAGTLISRGRISAATITKRHSAPNACSIVTKPPRSYSHATRPTDAPAAYVPRPSSFGFSLLW